MNDRLALAYLGEDSDGHHEEEGGCPDHQQHAVRVLEGLPAPGPQRLADGEETLDGYNDEGEAAHGHGHR